MWLDVVNTSSLFSVFTNSFGTLKRNFTVGPTGELSGKGEIHSFGESTTGTRLRFRGLYSSVPSAPPLGEVDFSMVDVGSNAFIRVSYNSQGVIKAGTIPLT